MRRVLTLLTAAWLATGAADAATPTLDALLPSGAQRGTKDLEVKGIGKIDPWPAQIWCSDPAVRFEAEEEKGTFRVSIGKAARLGPCWVRVFNEEGTSDPRLFVISGMREITENGEIDNNAPSQPADVGSLPVVINGRLEKSQDIDCWKVSLKKGDQLEARLDGYALRSGIDPFLHLYDPDGTRIVLASDHPRNLDPRISHPVERTGHYVIGVMAIASPPNANVTFHGASGATYRLSLATGPASLTPELTGVADGAPAKKEEAFPLSENDGAAGLPLKGFGTLAKPGDSHRIRFKATKGQSLELAAEALDYGFETDPVLVLEKADGSVIRETDDTKPDQDAIYLYRVAADGEYAVRITDRFGRGGEEGFRYHLSLAEAEKRFSGTVDKHAYTGNPGETIAVKASLTRTNGHTDPLSLKVEGLPDGVTLESSSIEEKATTADLKLKIEEKASPFSGPIWISAAPEEGGESLTLPYSFQDTNARGPYLKDEIAPLWLTIQAKKEEK